MAWTSVTTIAPISSWLFSDPVEGKFFRLKHSSFPRDGSYEIAQAEVDTDGTIHLFDIQQLNPRLEPETIEFRKPGVFSSRRIALRRIAKQPTLESELRRVIRDNLLRDPEESLFPPRRVSWQIAVEVSDYIEPTTGSNASNPSTLQNNIVAFWKLEETTGNRSPSVGNIQLTSNNNVIGVTGKIGGCAEFSRSNWLSTADGSDLPVGNADFTIAGWFNLASKPQDNLYALAKSGGSQQFEYALLYRNYSGENKLVFAVENFTKFVESATTAINQNTWYFLVAWHDATAKTINIQIDNGAVATTALGTTTITPTTFKLNVGAFAAGITLGWHGKIDASGLWKRILAEAERTELWNNGAGKEV